MRNGMRERAKSGARTKKARGGRGEAEKEMEKRRLQTTQFERCFKIETTTIFSMLNLENLLQKKLELLAVNLRNRPIRWTLLELFQRVSAKAKYILALYFYLAIEEHNLQPTKLQVADLSRLGISAV